MYKKSFIKIKFGENILDEIRYLKLSIKEFSIKSKIPIKDLKKIINSKKKINKIEAKKISRVLGASPEFWMNLSKNNER